MSKKAPIIEYNEDKAPWYFVLYKLLELGGLWVFTFGFYYFGYYLANFSPCFKEWVIQNNILVFPITKFDYWGFGFGSIALLALILYLIMAWIRGNWYLAKKKTETPKGKEKRELTQQNLDRAEYGYSIGDKIKVKSWEELTDEFYETTNGNIKIGGYVFYSDKKYQCGKIYTIKRINYDKVYVEETNSSFRNQLFKLHKKITLK